MPANAIPSCKALGNLMQRAAGATVERINMVCMLATYEGEPANESTDVADGWAETCVERLNY